MKNLPKRISIDSIRNALGDKQVDRILGALLRERASHIRSVTTDQIVEAREYVSGNTTQCALAGFRRLSTKWIMENNAAKKAFLSYLTRLENGAKRASSTTTRKAKATKGTRKATKKAVRGRKA